MTRLSWRKNKTVGFGAKSYSLWRGTVQLATAQAHSGHSDRFWFWYGDGINTCNSPADLATVKADAIAHFKAKEK